MSQLELELERIRALTSLSTLWRSLHIEYGPSCTGARCPAPMGRQGWGPSTSSRSKGGLRQWDVHSNSAYQTEGNQLTFRDSQGRRPLIPQDVETDGAICIDVGMVDLGREANFGGLERIIGRESDGEEEDAAGVWGVPL
jgi:hypothetical protein